MKKVLQCWKYTKKLESLTREISCSTLEININIQLVQISRIRAGHWYRAFREKVIKVQLSPGHSSDEQYFYSPLNNIKSFNCSTKSSVQLSFLIDIWYIEYWENIECMCMTSPQSIIT